MKTSLTNVMHIISSSLQNELIKQSDFNLICQRGELLPTVPIISNAGFECHLTLDKPRTDFLVSFSGSNCSRDNLLKDKKTLFQALQTSHVWNKIYNFHNNWTDSKSQLNNDVDHIWLEFDIDSREFKIPEPSLFFAPKKIVKDNQTKLNYNIVENALELLLARKLPYQTKQQLNKSLNLLPIGAKVFEVGIMLPREQESQAIRLCVENIPKSKISNYLTDIEWTDSSNNLSSILPEIFELVDDIKLNFAIEQTVYPKVGFECYFNNGTSRSPKLRAFLEYLVNKKMCTSERADALLAWSGYSEENCYPELWPEHFSKASKFVNPNFRSTIVRLLHHIKIVYHPNQPLQAKAYLWFGHRWLATDGKLIK